jgi:hypothetical protein
MAEKTAPPSEHSSTGSRVHHARERGDQTRSPDEREKRAVAERERRKRHEVKDRQLVEELRTARNTLNRYRLERDVARAQLSHFQEEQRYTGNLTDVEVDQPDTEDEFSSDEDMPDDGHELSWDPSKAEDRVRFLLSTDSLCERGTHHTPAEFEELFDDLEDTLEHTTNLGARAEHRYSKPRRLSSKAQLFMFLWFCAEYMAIWRLGLEFSVPIRICHKLLKRCSGALRTFADAARWADGGMVWPTGDELEQLRVEEAEMCNAGLEAFDFAIDGLHWRQHAPSAAAAPNIRERLWTPFEKMFALTSLFVVSRRGRIVQMIGPFVEPNEQAVIKRANRVHQWLLDNSVGILHDARYVFDRVADPENTRVRAAWTLGPGTLAACKKWAQLLVGTTASQVCVHALHNSHLASEMRAVVENLMVQLRHWKILEGPFRTFLHGGSSSMYGLSADDILTGLAFLTNRRMLKRDTLLRPHGWKPKAAAAALEAPDEAGEPFTPTESPWTNKPFVNDSEFIGFVRVVKKVFTKLSAEPGAPRKARGREIGNPPSDAWIRQFDTELIAAAPKRTQPRRGQRGAAAGDAPMAEAGQQGESDEEQDESDGDGADGIELHPYECAVQ